MADGLLCDRQICGTVARKNPASRRWRKAPSGTVLSILPPNESGPHAAPLSQEKIRPSTRVPHRQSATGWMQSFFETRMMLHCCVLRCWSCGTCCGLSGVVRVWCVKRGVCVVCVWVRLMKIWLTISMCGVGEDVYLWISACVHVGGQVGWLGCSVNTMKAPSTSGK